MRRELFLIVFSTVLALLGAELVLGHYFPQRTVRQFLEDRPAMYRSSEALFTELLPNFQGILREAEFETAIRVNSLGYRQDEFDPHKSTQRRILMIGDSFTFGYGVEESDSYPRVLERELTQTGSGNVSAPIEVINAGVPTWWTDAYYLYLKERGLALEPDLILLGLFTGNDIDARDARRAIWPQVDAAGLPLQTSTAHIRIENGHRVRVTRRARWRIPILRDSHVFQLLYTAQLNARRRVKPKIQSLSLYQPVYTQQTQAIVEKVKKLIIAMASLSQQRGAQFAVVMLPERQQISAVSPTAYGKLDFDKPQRLFAEFLTQQDIPYLDLLPILRGAAQDTADDVPLYYQYDSHFTVEGHRLSGREIAQYVLTSGLLSSDSALETP